MKLVPDMMITFRQGKTFAIHRIKNRITLIVLLQKDCYGGWTC